MAMTAAERQRRYRERHPRILSAVDKQQRNASGRAWYMKNQEYASDRSRQRRYGLEPGEYARMVEVQEGRCLLCGEMPSAKGLCVDHDHTTGVVRGLLCNRCNVGLHYLENEDFCASAERYLGRSF